MKLVNAAAKAGLLIMDREGNSFWMSINKYIIALSMSTQASITLCVSCSVRSMRSHNAGSARCARCKAKAKLESTDDQSQRSQVKVKDQRVAWNSQVKMSIPCFFRLSL